MHCMECGHLGATGQTHCSQCESRTAPEPLPPRLEHGLLLLQQATAALTAGQSTVLEYESVLDRKKVSLEEQLAHLTGIPLTPDLAQEASEQIALGVAGIHTWLASLETLRRAAHARQAAGLQEGLEQARLATDLLNVALTRNWQSYYAIKATIDSTWPQLQSALANLPDPGRLNA